MVTRYPEYRPARVARVRRSRLSGILIRSISEQLADSFVSSCRRGETRFLLPDTPIPRHRDLGSCLDVDRCSLLIERSATGNVVQDMNYDAFGNALGFNAATALTTYLYSSMPYDAASGNYYDHARFYDSGTGSFTQSDYGYSGSLANPMADLPYAFTDGDPINMLDLSGHGFMDLMVSLSIQAIFTAISVPALAGATSLLTGGSFWGGLAKGSVAGLALGFLVIEDEGVATAKFATDVSEILLRTVAGVVFDELGMWGRDPNGFTPTVQLANNLFWKSLTTFSEAKALDVGFDSPGKSALWTAATRGLLDAPVVIGSLATNISDEIRGVPANWGRTEGQAANLIVDAVAEGFKAYVNEGLPNIKDLPVPFSTAARILVWSGWDALLQWARR